jgi:hypothetical protein
MNWIQDSAFFGVQDNTAALVATMLRLCIPNGEVTKSE